MTKCVVNVVIATYSVFQLISQKGSIQLMEQGEVKSIIPPQYDEIELFPKYRLALALKQGQLMLIHIDKPQSLVHVGKLSMTSVEKEEEEEFSSRAKSKIRVLSRDFMALKQGKKWGIFRITENKEEVLPPIYQNIQPLSGALIKIRKEDLWGLALLTEQGEKILLSPKYQNIRGKGLGFVAVREGDKWGLMSINVEKRQTNLITPLKYEKIDDLSNGLFLVKAPGAWWFWRKPQFGFVNTKGQEVIPTELQYHFMKVLSNDLVKAGSWNRWGLLQRDCHKGSPSSGKSLEGVNTEEYRE